MSKQKMAVLGTGAWGTTFAQVLADCGHKVHMWGRRQSVVDMINAHQNPQYLPGVELPAGVTATSNIAEAVDGADMVFVAVPVGATSDVVRACVAQNPSATYVSLSKGIEVGTKRTVAEAMQLAGNLDTSQVAVISGPNLSREIAKREPAATVAASEDMETAKRIAKACHSSYFRPYVSTDVVGCEVAGATKNVIAIAIGATEGQGYATNTRATLMTRGLAEMTRLGEALGADPATFAGLAGIGDLIATCSSRLSRNYSLGLRLGQGMALDEALGKSAGVAEGAKTAGPLLEVAQAHGVDMPITAGVVAALSGQATVAQMGQALLDRPQKMDGWEIELLD